MYRMTLTANPNNNKRKILFFDFKVAFQEDFINKGPLAFVLASLASVLVSLVTWNKIV